MAPETRSQDVRRMDDSLEAANQRVNGIENKLHAQSDDLAQLKAMMKEMANQQISIKQTLSRRPRRDFPSFEGEEVHKWLYKCNQYFDLEEIPETDKLKLEYVDALCCRFGGQKDPLEELTEHKQEGDLEGYIRDFDMLWNRAQISEKQALVFFLGGLEVEIKNLVKMFEPKSLKQAYNLARLYSLCIVEDDGDNSEEEETVETRNTETLTPHLSLQAIHGT
uniref:Ty3 transposon capsid-like protein domain-containing protein n=1 Tax=Populus alba TaxID=43335 RepID=A0A4V6XVS8_POPAL|nr:hypothetical protein D5086_0000317890 [Populus alba]